MGRTMKQTFIAIVIFSGILIFFTSANGGNLYNCIDSNGNKIVTDSPQDGMKDCVLKDSFTDPSPEERAQQQKKTYKSRNETKAEREKESAKKDKEREAAEKEEAALMREGNKCYTEQLNVISGGSVSDVYFWRICKDKNGKTVSKRKL
jgi:hypothetical protein